VTLAGGVLTIFDDPAPEPPDDTPAMSEEPHPDSSLIAPVTTTAKRLSDERKADIRAVRSSHGGPRDGRATPYHRVGSPSMFERRRRSGRRRPRRRRPTRSHSSRTTRSPTPDTSLNDALAEFSAETGIDVEILVAGDAGTMLSKAALTAGNPEGDVMWGIDNTLLSRAIADDVFEPYVATRSPRGRWTIAEELLELVPNGEATPVDYGDVCVNYDIAWYAERDLDPPSTFADLADPAYAGQLVVQNPATSSPGLAFLLATIHEYGLEGWQDYWSRLGENGVEVVDGWTEAYYERFTWAGGGRRRWSSATDPARPPR
jgi:hypothetical protein